LSMEALKPMTARDVRADTFPRGRFLLMDGRDIEACLKAARLTRRWGGKVVVDIGSPRKRMDELFGLTDYFIASHAFVTRYFGRMSPETACRRILAGGPGVVVITLGESGCIVATVDEFIKVPAFKRENFVVDTTGAGDVFHGAFIFGLTKGWSLERCARFANATAFLKCGKLGGRAGIPTLGVVQEFLKHKGHP
ncbi:MAG: carbohydrate kinase family protein, partial [bacterium]